VKITLPRLYAIADYSLLIDRNLLLNIYVEELAAAGIRLLQWRAKHLSPRAILAHAATLKDIFPGTLIMNDRPDLALLAGFSGVHLGQDDLAPADARRLLGPDAIIGLSTHSEAQLRAAADPSPDQPADYLAVGPIFATGTKLDASPVVGLDLIRRARDLTSRPIVAIGGITRANAASVLAAGADSVAVISGLLPTPDESILQVARDFLGILG
jgi:thiamine-phosphate pyrophosphorylase